MVIYKKQGNHIIHALSSQRSKMHAPELFKPDTSLLPLSCSTPRHLIMSSHHSPKLAKLLSGQKVLAPPSTTMSQFNDHGINLTASIVLWR